MKFKNTPACAGIDVEVFFTEEKGNYVNLDFIKRMCSICPARVECFEYAIENLVQGIWAGTTTNERNRYRSKHGIIGKTVVPDSIFRDIIYEQTI